MYKYKVKCPTCQTQEQEIDVALKLQKILCRKCSKPMEIKLINNEGK